VFDQAHQRAINPHPTLDQLIAWAVPDARQSVRTGKHYISFNLRLRMRNYHSTLGISDVRHINKGHRLRNVIKSIINDTLSKRHYGPDSEPEITMIDNVRIRIYHNQKLIDVKLKQETLAYKLLGNQEDINRNAGQCVLDYILSETSSCYSFKGITRPKLIEYFGQDCLTNGISTSQIRQWAEQQGCINITALDPFHKSFDELRVSRPRLNLVFLVNNNHVYAIKDEETKKHIAKTHRYDLKDIAYNVKFDKWVEFSPTNEATQDMNELLEGKFSNERIVLYSGTDDLKDLVSRVMNKTKTMVVNMKIQDGIVSSFEHPISGQIIIAAPDIDDRQALLAKMKKLIYSHHFDFRNQSYCQAANSWFKLKYGKLPKSTYSDEMHHIFDTYPLNAYVHVFGEPVGEMSSVDIKRCYTSIYLSNEMPFNVFSAFDEVKRFQYNENKGIIPGEYYITKNFAMKPELIFSMGWYPAILVQYLVQKHYIEPKDIKYIIRPSRILKANYFQPFVSGVLHNFPQQAKQLINAWNGNLYKKTYRTDKGCITDSFDVAVGMRFNHPNCTITSFGDKELFFIRDKDQTPLSSGHVPIYRHVIASSYVMLDKMYDAVVKPGNTVVSINTDSIKMTGPKPDLPSKDKVQVGEFGIEPTSSMVFGIKDVTQRDDYKWKAPKPMTKLTSINELPKDESCLVTGCAGSGKTMLITQLVEDEKKKGEKTKTLSYTNKAVANLINRGITDACTFDSFFSEYQGDKEYARKLSSYTRIFVDEFTMAPSRFYIILNTVKRRNPNIKIMLFGDPSQCKPVEPGMWYDYMRSRLIRDLTDSNHLQLQYIEGQSRYDKKLFDELEHLKANQMLSAAWKSQLKVKMLPLNICRTNATRNEVNKRCFEHFSKGKTLITVNDVDYYVKMPLICYESIKKLKIYNSERYCLMSINKTAATMSIAKYKDCKTISDTLVELPLSKISHFEYGFCTTMYKWQGETINEPYNVYDIGCSKMTLNELYTAISRATKFENVHLQMSASELGNRVFEIAKPPIPSIMLKYTRPTTLKGRVYKIFKEGNPTEFYVGSTPETLDIRLAQHFDKPVNQKMEEFLKTTDKDNVKIELLEETMLCKNDSSSGRHNHRELELLEIEWIKALNPPLNVLHKVKAPKKPVKIEIKQERIITRFKVIDNEKMKAYCITFSEPGKQYCTKKVFRYKKDKPAALAKAQAFRQQLIQRFY